MATSGKVVLVTGGSGFLGQHIVSQLQQHGENVKEIRILDMKPYTNTLGHQEKIPVKSIVGSICDLSDARSALKGVNSVYHVAGVVSFGTSPDFKGMEHVNVTGTSTLLDACKEECVERMIFASTVDVVVGFEEIVNGDERSCPVPKKFLFRGYPDTKYRAECLVREANGFKLSNGSQLRTLVLRPNVMYGVGDPYYIPNALKAANKSRGVLQRVGDGRAKFQHAYVGNVAWMFICADRALKQNEKIGGEVYFACDDSPVKNALLLMEPYLIGRGFRLSSSSLPYWMIYSALYAFETALWVISPIKKMNILTSLCSLVYINTTIYFKYDKARVDLGYSPIFTPEESEKVSLPYYKKLVL